MKDILLGKHRTMIEVGEMQWHIKSIECCGNTVYYGAHYLEESVKGHYFDAIGQPFMICCRYASHESNKKAVECVKKRVAKGFSMEV